MLLFNSTPDFIHNSIVMVLEQELIGIQYLNFSWNGRDGATSPQRGFSADLFIQDKWPLKKGNHEFSEACNWK